MSRIFLVNWEEVHKIWLKKLNFEEVWFLRAQSLQTLASQVNTFFQQVAADVRPLADKKTSSRPSSKRLGLIRSEFHQPDGIPN